MLLLIADHFVLSNPTLLAVYQSGRGRTIGRRERSDYLLKQFRLPPFFSDQLPDPLFQQVQVPVALLADDGAQHGVDLADAVEDIGQQLVLLPGAGDLSRRFDHVTQNDSL